MPITSKLRLQGELFNYSIAFRNYIETFIPSLVSSTDSRLVPLNMDLAFKFTGDLKGYLISIGVPDSIHYIVLRMNGYTSYHQFPGQSQYILLPGDSDVQTLRSTYMSQLGKVF